MTGTIEGTVTDEEGDGIEDATVTVADAATEDLETTTTTDETGTYSVEVAPDTYDVRAERIGFAADEERVTVGPDVTKTVDLRLVKLSADVVGEITDGPGIGVLGTVADDSGSSIGVRGDVAFDAGYGLYTPNDARIDGIIDTVEEWQIAIDGERSLQLGAPTEFVDNRRDYTGSGSAVIGHLNDIDPRVAGAVISGGGRYDHDDDESLGNRITDHFGTIGGGVDNRAGDDDDDPESAAGVTVGGGFHNEARGSRSTVAGGQNNTATSNRSTISGGINNTASGHASTVGGGEDNEADGEYSTIGGGEDNDASADEATVSGGASNEASSERATVGGGRFNEATGERATIGGGFSNTASDLLATVGGGGRNKASDIRATVGGGGGNEASGGRATVAGGAGNKASNLRATVGGGFSNEASGQLATVAGGASNEASGTASVVPGGRKSTAGGDDSFATGFKAKSNHDGAFVVANSGTFPVRSESADEVRFQAGGGFVIEDLPTGSGKNLQWDNGALVRDTSSARYKTNIEPLETDPGAVLDVEPRSFEYTETGAKEVGLIAEEVDEHVPELVMRDDEGRPDAVKYNRLGVYLVPEVRRQRDRLNDQEDQITDQRDRIDELEQENAELRERLAALEEHVGVPPIAADGRATEPED